MTIVSTQQCGGLVNMLGGGQSRGIREVKAREKKHNNTKRNNFFGLHPLHPINHMCGCYGLEELLSSRFNMMN